MPYTRPDWAPTLEDVAALTPEFTRETIEVNGRPQLTFTATTAPTATAVEGFIDAGVQEILGRVGIAAFEAEFYDDDDFLGLAKTAAKWHAASTIEAERMPAGVEDASGAFHWKQASYVACLNELIAQARRVRPAVD